MRIVCFLLLLMVGCSSHDVRCDRHLERINPPIGDATGVARGPT